MTVVQNFAIKIFSSKFIIHESLVWLHKIWVPSDASFSGSIETWNSARQGLIPTLMTVQHLSQTPTGGYERYMFLWTCLYVLLSIWL